MWIWIEPGFAALTTRVDGVMGVWGNGLTELKTNKQ